MRRYASTEAGSSSGSTLPWIGAAAAILGGGYYFTLRNPDKTNEAKHKVEEAVGAAKDKANELSGVAAKKVFTGGDQGFVSLKLDSVEKVSENTKVLKFSFPEADQVSGLQVACVYTFTRKGISARY